DVQHFALDVAEGALQADPVPYSDPVGRHHREVSGESEDDGLQGEGDAGRGESQACDEGRELAREVEDEHEGHGGPHHDLPGYEKEPTTIGVPGVPLRGPSP